MGFTGERFTSAQASKAVTFSLLDCPTLKYYIVVAKGYVAGQLDRATLELQGPTPTGPIALPTPLVPGLKPRWVSVHGARAYGYEYTGDGKRVRTGHNSFTGPPDVRTLLVWNENMTRISLASNAFGFSQVVELANRCQLVPAKG